MFGIFGCVCYEYVDCLCCVDMYVGQCQCDCLLILYINVSVCLSADKLVTGTKETTGGEEVRKGDEESNSSGRGNCAR